MNRFLLSVAFCFVWIFTVYSQELADTTAIRKLSEHIAASKFWTTNPDSQYYYSNKGLKAAKQIKDFKGQADMYKFLGIYHWSKGEMLETMIHYRRAKELYDSLGLRKDAVIINLNISMVYSRLGDYDKAVSSNYESIRFLEKNRAGNLSHLASSYNSLGLVFRNINDYPAALEAFKQSFDFYEQLNDSLGMAGFYTNSGTVYSNMGNYDLANQYFTKALRMFEKQNNARGIAISYNNLVGTAHKAGRLSDAFLYSQIAYGISIDKGFKDSQIAALISMGDIRSEQGLYKEALEFFNKAKDLSLSLGNKRRQVEIYKGIATCKRALKQYDEAFRYNDLYVALKDSLYNTENSSTIENLRISYEVEKKDAEIILLAKDNEIEKLNKKNLLFIFISAIAVLILSVSMLIIRNKKDRKMSEQKERLALAERAIINAQLQNRIEREEELGKELDFKNRALTTYTLNLVQKNAMLDEIRNIAKEVLKRPETKDSELRKLVKAIDYSFSLDNDWDGFRTYFEQVHPDFFKKLKESFPNLSNTELRLCSLIRLSLSIKESAQLLSISPDSVKVARHRIRKKLNLELDDNLTEFIMSI